MWRIQRIEGKKESENLDLEYRINSLYDEKIMNEETTRTISNIAKTQNTSLAMLKRRVTQDQKLAL